MGVVRRRSVLAINSSAAAEMWAVSAVVTQRGGGRQWPTVGLTHGTQTTWITVDDDDVVRFEPLPDVRVGADDRLTWNGRTYTVAARGTYTVTGVGGATEAAVGDRASYLTLTNPQESERLRPASDGRRSRRSNSAQNRRHPTKAAV